MFWSESCLLHYNFPSWFAGIKQRGKKKLLLKYWVKTFPLVITEKGGVGDVSVTKFPFHGGGGLKGQGGW